MQKLLLMRKRDRQTVLFIPNSGRVIRSYLIDKHLVTNDQFAAFLNDPDIKNRVYARHQDGILTVVTASGEVLVGPPRLHLVLGDHHAKVVVISCLEEQP